MTTTNLARKIARLEDRLRAGLDAPATPRTVAPGQYAGDPVGYIRNELNGKPSAKQEEICRLLHTPPYRVLCEAAHMVGKTWLAGALTSWHYDAFETGWTITTGPSKEHVEDVLWTEIRIQRERAGLGGFRGDRAPELYDNPNHYAKGITTAKGEAFQGRHPERLFFVFDEAVGIEAERWNNAKSMFKQNGKHHWFAILNPTDTTSQAYIERHKVDADGNPAWHVVQMSSLDHPNIQAGLEGRELPYPNAVSVEDFVGWLADWSDPIDAEEAGAEDIQWPLEWWRAKHTPDAPARWWRPGPLMQGRALGVYPSSATYGVWSDRAWNLALLCNLTPPAISTLPQIGCDVALKGDDYTAIHVRWGHWSLHHERHNGWEYDQTAERLKTLAGKYADYINERRPKGSKPVEPQEIPVKIDADAYGAGVVQLRGGYNFVGLAGSSSPRDGSQYFNRRTELWFTTVKLAKKGLLDLSRLPQEHRQRLRQQCFAPLWEPDWAGRHQVEYKVMTKRRLGHSPDDADAMNLAYADAVRLPLAEVVPAEKAKRTDPRDSRPEPSRHGLFGRR